MIRSLSRIPMKEGAAMKSCEQNELLLQGLCCANCARKIEESVAKLDGVHAASVNLMAQKLTVTVCDAAQWPAIQQQAAKIATDTEPHIRVKALSPSAPAEKTADKAEATWWRRLLPLLAGSLLFTVALALPAPVSLGLYVAAYLLIGGEVLLRAARNILKGEIFDENFLMCVATVGAFAIGEYPEGVAVMLFYQIGEWFQDLAVSRSRRSITALMDIRPDFAMVKDGGDWRRVSPEQVAAGDVIQVKAGERIPLDGRVLTGRASLDTSALTGESLPRDVEPGSDVLSGSVNTNGLLTMEVTKVYGESTVARILDLVQNAAGKKAPAENFITRFARVYTPIVVFAALALAVIPPLVIPGAAFAEWIHRALVFLVVSCPCALVISIPLSFFGGIGGASRQGILVKGSQTLDILSQTDTVVFDKTGTLTQGVFRVVTIEAAAPFDPDTLLSLAAHAESVSNHPIAASIQSAYGRAIDGSRVLDQREIAGQGLRATVDGQIVLAGNARLMASHDIAFTPAETDGTVVYIAVNQRFAGYLVIADSVKADSRRTVNELKAMGLGVAMLTGDQPAAARRVAQELDVDRVYAGLLPQQKVEQLETLLAESSGKLAFVGDGINDAPVLARADVGIAMGGLGSDAAIEAADAVIMTDEPSKLATAIRIARKTRRIVWQNIVFALGVKAVILILGAFGVATMWEAVFGDVGVALIAILNAMRAMRWQSAPAKG